MTGSTWRELRKIRKQREKKEKIISFLNKINPFFNGWKGVINDLLFLVVMFEIIFIFVLLK